MDTTKHYVVGFMFDEELERVALIRKQKPAWQNGLLNGIGGKVEEYELNFMAMIREFKEETGRDTIPSQWTYFCEMKGGENDDGGAFRIAFFATRGDVDRLRTMEEEEVLIIHTNKIHPDCVGVVENLPWLIALAIDCLRDGRPKFSIVEYP